MGLFSFLIHTIFNNSNNFSQYQQLAPALITFKYKLQLLNIIYLITTRMRNSTLLFFIAFFVLAFTQSPSQCSDFCTACDPNTFQCSGCVNPYFLRNGTCFRCPQGCDSCVQGGVPGRPPFCLNCAPPLTSNHLGICFSCDSNCLTCYGSPTNCSSCKEGTQIQRLNGTVRCGPLANCPIPNCAECGQGRQNETVCVRCVKGYFSFRGKCLLCKFPCKQCNFDRNAVNNFVQMEWYSILAGLFGQGNTFNRMAIQHLLPPFMEGLDFSNMNQTNKDGWVQGYLGFRFFSSQIRQINYLNYSSLDPNIISQISNITFNNVDVVLIGIVNTLFRKNYTLQQFYNKTFLISDVLATCVQCSAGFQNSTNGTGSCQKCSPKCTSCSGGVCLTCQPGFFINGTFLCQRCNQTCLQCSQTPSSCTKCPAPTSLFGTECFLCNNPACATCLPFMNFCLTCKAPYSSRSDNGTCYRCAQDLCKTCRPPTVVGNSTISYCTECKAGSILFDGKCQVCPQNCESCYPGNIPFCFQCKIGFSLINENNITRCDPCPNGCMKCYDSNSSLCLQCMTGSFLNPQTKKCQKCKDGCQACTSLEVCTSFQPGIVIIANQTIKCRPGCKACNFDRPDQCSQCGSRYFKDGTDCRQCPSGCLQCSDPYTCTKCADNLNLNGGNCSECQGNCRTCPVGNSTLCLSCKRGSILVGTQCLKQCERGCLECDPNNSSICFSCTLGHALRPNGKCVKCLKSCSGSCDPKNINQCLSCVDGFELSSGQCKRCPKGCATCLNGQCQTCVVGFRLIQNLAGSFICAENCKPPCTDCTQTSCLACEPGFNLTNGICLPFTGCNPNCDYCPSGTFKHDASGQCRRCLENCASCVNGASCLQCQGGFYNNNGQCSPCPPQCKTCYDRTRCIQCSAGFVKQIVSMDSDVTSAVYSDNCIACSSNCKTCQVQPERCTSCSDGSRLFSSRCAGMFTVVYQFVLNFDYSLFLENSETQVFIQAITSLLRINSSDNYINSIRNGSVLVEGQASSGSQQQAQAMTNTLGSAGSSLGGFTITSSSTNVYYGDSVYVAPPTTQQVKTEQKPNIGLIIGVVVGGVVLIIVITVLIYKLKCKKSQINDLDASKNELNQIGGEISYNVIMKKN